MAKPLRPVLMTPGPVEEMWSKDGRLFVKCGGKTYEMSDRPVTLKATTLG